VTFERQCAHVDAHNQRLALEQLHEVGDVATELSAISNHPSGDSLAQSPG
jgi:hypothetical protein